MAVSVGKAPTPQQVADMIRADAEKMAQAVEKATEVVEFSESMHQRTVPVNETPKTVMMIEVVFVRPVQ